MSHDRIISADDHMDLNVLPPTLWQERLPSRLAADAPRVVDTPDGAFWQAGGQLLSPSGRRGKGLLHAADHGFRPGEPKTRLEDMDRDGVYCQVIYGPPTGLALTDAEIRTACVRAYNDWAAEFNAFAPDRLVVLALLPGHDPGVARAELGRVAQLGHKGAFLYVWESPVPVFDASWDAFWDAAEEVGLPIHVHLGGGLHSLRGQPGSWRMPAMVSVIPLQLDEVLAGMIFSGALERRPALRLVLGESGLGWIPYVLERMDHEHRKYADIVSDVRLSTEPSAIFHRQVYATYEEDELAARLLDRIGVDNIMWASDYPHGDSTWPRSREAIADSWLSTLAPEEQRKILFDNASRLYGIS